MCRKLIYLISFVLVLAIGNMAQAGLPEWEAAINGANPFHWYKFNETTGTDCVDSGSAGLNGTYNGVSLNQEGYLGSGTAAGFDRSAANVVNFDGATELAGPWTAEYIVKTTKPPAGQESQALHDSDITSIRLAGWTSLGEAGFTLYGIADYQFTPVEGLTLEDLVVQQDEWMHIVWRNDGSGTQLFFNGKLVGTSTDSVALGRLRIGGRGAITDALDGVLDEAVVFDRALTDADIIAHTDAAGLVERRAIDPSPANGAMLSEKWVSLGWSPGYGAVSHDVYLGDNFDDVNDGTPDSSGFRGNQPLTPTTLFVGFFGCPYPDGLVPGTTYYWRVDEVNDTDPNSPWKGPVWSFWLPPKTAYNPDPADGAWFVDPNVELNWVAGFGAALHTVYFGDNFDDVNNATEGGTSQTDTTYTPGPLELDKVYYWRVDEFDLSTTHKGDVWSFKILPDIPITDPNLVGWWTLDEGMGVTVLDWSGHGNSGTLANGTQWVAGNDGDALEFDGSDDHVDLGTPSELYIPGNYTYTAWFKVGEDINGDSGVQYLLCIGSRSDLVFGVEDGVGIDGDLSLHYYDTVPGFHAVGVGKTVWSSDEWHMVAGTKDSATGHKIYLDGELRNSDFNTNDDNYATDRMVSLGARAWTGHQYFNGTIDDVRIYNRTLTQDEIIQVMRGDPLLAWSPKPSNGSTLYIRDATPLSWSPGENASQHDVYFGIDKDAVADANTSTTDIYRGRQFGTSYTPPEGVEWGGGPYYWRVDEYNTDATISEGRIWSFTVTDFILVDDFEDYNDYEPYTIFDAWLDGWGVDTNGSEVGYAEPDFPGGEHFVETNIVHGGSQSMPYFYDNNFKYSEATYSTTQRDWTEEGVEILSLWFYGDAANAAELMYVALNGGTAVYHDNPDAALIDTWTEWTIELQEFTGVNLTNVNTLAIGFGDKNNLQAGGSGLVLFDDIRLYRPAPEPEPETP